MRRKECRGDLNDMKGVFSNQGKFWKIGTSVTLIIVILFGYMTASFMSSSAPAMTQSGTMKNVQLGPMGIINGLGCCNGPWVAGTSVSVDPPQGQPFQDPAVAEDLNNDPTIAEYNIEAKIALVNINGVEANLMTYNGYYPGPTIYFNKGDTLKIHFKNSLPATQEKNILGFMEGITNVHTHGFHVSPIAPSDDPTLTIAPGQTYDYQYNTSLHPAGSFNFYHNHIHGLTAEQFWSGLAGSLICKDDTNALADYETHILFIKDISLAGTQPAAYSIMDYVIGKEGNIVMVNGMVNPVLSIRPGQVQRWHIINACNARFIRLSLQQHDMQLIGTDGGLLDKPYAIPEILLTPSERIDVLIKGSETQGNFKLLALPYNRGCGSPPQTVTLMTLSYQGEPMNQQLPTTVNPNAARLNINLSNTPVRHLYLSMMMGRGFINGQDFDTKPFTITSMVGTYEIWEISSQCMMDHVFHMHINHFQILSVIGGYPGYNVYTQMPAWKDSVYVPRGGTARILVQISDFTGMTMFHCHIVEHEDIGMMGMWDIQPQNGTMPM